MPLLTNLGLTLLLGYESKLSPEMPTYSIFPDDYNVKRKDRDQNGGGVL